MTLHTSLSALPLHLLRLISPSLPVGSFSYSRGLEWVVHIGTVKDAQTAREWILGILEHSYAPLDGALFWRMMHALRAGDEQRFLDLNDWVVASRESREIQLEDRRMGEAMLSLLAELGVTRASTYSTCELSYPATFALAANHWNILPMDALAGLMWSVVESQVAAAIRLVPLGHTDGQRTLIASVPVIERAVLVASTLEEGDIGNVAFSLAMASAWHETQYSRLFRSCVITD